MLQAIITEYIDECQMNKGLKLPMTLWDVTLSYHEKISNPATNACSLLNNNTCLFCIFELD